MRASPHPPRPTANAATPDPPTRKVFNCIVDDTALIAGVKKSTRDGIRKWLSQRAICLFVPLHTLTALHRLKNGTDRLSADASDAVKWLDDITSSYHSSLADPAHRVVLEGVDEAYHSWDDVAKFMLPDTLLSMHDTDSDDDDDDDDLESSFNALDMSDATSMSSAHSLDHPAPTTPHSPPSTITNTKDAAPPTSSKRAVPAYLKPLFSHLLWRINKESNPDAALASYILLTNDPTKQMIASKFGVRAKRLEQLRDILAREDREYKNHLTLHSIEVETSLARKNPPQTPTPAERPKSTHSIHATPDDASDDDDDDVVLFHRAPRGPAPTTNTQRVWDPNDFGRANQQQSPRGGRGRHVAPRGRGVPSPRARGAFVPRGAYVPPAPQVRAPPTPRHDPNAPIDPNSFARSAPRASPARGRSGRKLWEPN